MMLRVSSLLGPSDSWDLRGGASESGRSQSEGGDRDRGRGESHLEGVDVVGLRKRTGLCFGLKRRISDESRGKPRSFQKPYRRAELSSWKQNVVERGGDWRGKEESVGDRAHRVRRDGAYRRFLRRAGMLWKN